jgi:uncharacterized membrane protein YfcA
MELTADWGALQWSLLALAALTVGVSKTGFGGIGLIAVFLMADLFGKNSVGILLPMLVVADITVYPLFRQYASWAPVWKLMPPMLVGLALGYVMLDRIPDQAARPVIGAIILLMVGIQLFRRYATEWFDKMAASKGFGLGAGVAGGISTMMANAAGPVIQLFLLSRRFEKMELIGIGARLFLLVNILKLPFMRGLDMINGESLTLNAMTVPIILIGVFFGRRLVRAVSQRVFEWLVVGFAILAGVRLIFY